MSKTTSIIRLLIREVTQDLSQRVMELQGIVGAVEDGIWGPETQEMWTKFVFKNAPDVRGASLEDLTRQWGDYGSDIESVNGIAKSYTPDVAGALEFLYDITDPSQMSKGAVAPASSQQTARESGGKRICILGDSHIASQFGISLEKKLRAAGFTVNRFGVGGSSAASWLERLSKVVKNGPYDVAIICLGTNDGANAHVISRDPERLAIMARKSAANIREIASKVGAQITFWIGPPKMSGLASNPHYQPYAMDHIYDAVTPIFPNTTFDSRNVDTSLGDHVHVYGATADNWAEEVANFVSTNI